MTISKRDRQQQEQSYRDLMGHEPPIDDTEQAWQWDYRGATKEERDALLERLDETGSDDLAEPIPGQTDLFGGVA